ncbi:MAG: phosphohistidine phosphatase SixA [Verrucomicrobia bacterium]|nr:phosphohistidine phosphatase SixA [Verrucomicrobiota bacterium]
MKVYLLRHGQAEAGYPDGQRKLTARGRGHAQLLGEWLQRSPEALPGRIICSPLVRARETLELLSAAWSDREPGEPEVLDALVPEGNPAAIVSILESMDEDVFLVGHNPHMEILASLLMSGERSRARLVMKTCVMLRFNWAPFANHGQTGPAELRWMLDPRNL